VNLPLPGEQFDVVLLFTVLSSIDDAHRVRRVLEEAKRVAAPGGVILIYEPRVRNPMNPAVSRVSRRQIAATLDSPVRRRTLTLFPAVARRLGRATDSLYPRLSRVAGLRTHQLLVYHRV
jgi:ubiquinone/menaquinone biosynthesis C-methylase UbiE